MNYSDRLENCKKQYPFKYWLEDYEEGIGLYSAEVCLKVESVFDNLIKQLNAAGELASDEAKLGCFKQAVLALNEIRRATPQLIESMEREEYCDLIDSIGEAAHLEPNKYGHGEGIATEWRIW